MDVFGDILETLHFRGSIFFQSDLAARWGMVLRDTGSPRFHIILSGQCFLGSDSHDAVKAEEADIIVLPHGGSHWIADNPGSDLIPSDRAGAACELGNPLFQRDEITNRLICGVVDYDQGASHPLLNALPSVMQFSKLESGGPIWSVVKLIDAEMRGGPYRSCRIIDRLTEVAFLQLLNHYVREHEGASDFLSGLRDRRVYRALALIHQEPEFNWTLAALGERVGMSRATLVKRFQDVVGVSPMAYIADWRMMKANSPVRYSTTPFELVADATGFASARTLNRAFQRHYGCTLSELRRAQHER